jgi:hypothetical protein
LPQTFDQHWAEMGVYQDETWLGTILGSRMAPQMTQNIGRSVTDIVPRNWFGIAIVVVLNSV